MNEVFALRYVLCGLRGDVGEAARLSTALKALPRVDHADLHRELRVLWVVGRAPDDDAIRQALKATGVELDPAYAQAVPRVTG